LGDLTSIISNQKERLGILGVGLTTVRIINTLWDYLLYPFVIWQLGLVFGGVVMTIVSMAVCLMMLYLYDYTKKDWLGIETIKSIRELSGDSWLGRIASRILEKGDPAAFVFLSLTFDPFITTAYMRYGRHQYNGLHQRDWMIFFSSGILGNAYWAVVSYTGVSLIEQGWSAWSTW
jgi:ABC-type transport system involved in multi-copper enzyme maturation permease subunit